MATQPLTNNIKKIASECGTEFYAKNSIAGFRHCLDLDVDGIEFDVHVINDHKVVVQHDATLNKNITRDASGKWLEKTSPALCDLTSEQLALYDIGQYRADSHEAKSYPNYRPLDGARIPHLSEFIALLKQSGKPTELWIELKTSPFDRKTSSDPARLLDRVLEQVESNNLMDQTVLLAFEWDLLVAAKQQLPNIQTNFLTINETTLQLLNRRFGHVEPALLYGAFDPKHFAGSLPLAIKAASGDYWGPWIKDVTEQDMAEAKAANLKVNLWGVDGNLAAINAAKELGGDAITTSNPTLV